MLLAVTAAGCRLIAEVDDKHWFDPAGSASSSGPGGAGAASSVGSGASSGAQGGSGGAGPIVCTDGLVECSSKCVDLTHDADHCGRCGRSCGDGVCSAGRCPVRTVGVTGAYTWTLQHEGGSLYWTNAIPPTVSKVAVTGGDSVTLIDDGEEPGGIFVSDAHLYASHLWLGDVASYDLSGAGAVPLANLPKPGQIRGDADSVYVAAFTAYNGGGAIWRVPKNGDPPYAIAPAQHWPLGIAIDDQYLYWLVTAEVDGPGTPAGIWKTGKIAGGPAELVAASSPGSNDVAIDAERLYWHDLAQGMIFSTPKGDLPPAPTEVVAERDMVPKMTADGGRLYWLAYDSGRVMSCRTDGSQVLVLADGQLPEPVAMAVGDTEVYWIANNEVRATPK